MDISKLKGTLSDVGNKAKSAVDVSKDFALNIADQNDDGKFDVTDISIISDAANRAVKQGAHIAVSAANEAKRQYDIAVLKPVFPETLNSADFNMTKLIRVVEREPKYINNDLTEGCIGHESIVKGMRYVNVFWDSIDKFGIDLKIDSNREFYYVDPTDSRSYIPLDSYFDYLKSARINELQMVAHELGASYFKVSYCESSKQGTTKSAKLGANAGKIKNNNEISSISKSSQNMKVEAENHFSSSHEPVRPVLRYLRNNQAIETLVEMRMSQEGPLSKQAFSIEFNNCSGMRETDAARIDGVLKGLKSGIIANMAKEAAKESKKSLNYEVVF